MALRSAKDLRMVLDYTTDLLRIGHYGQVLPMALAAEDVSCYQAGLESERCDFWQLTIPNALASQADNLWYRFIVSDGSDTDYYGDNTAALDGGPGATSDDAIDQSWALMQHVPGFTAPAWAKDAVIYQIFPDRFRNGRANNDPRTGDVRYEETQWFGRTTGTDITPARYDLVCEGLGGHGEHVALRRRRDGERVPARPKGRRADRRGVRARCPPSAT